MCIIYNLKIVNVYIILCKCVTLREKPKKQCKKKLCRGGVAIPYSLHTNPINIGYPDFLGMGAAVMGDGNYYRSGFGLRY